MTVLLTRSEMQNAAMLFKLDALGVQSEQVSLIEQKRLANCDDELREYSNNLKVGQPDAVIFISPSAVEFGAQSVASFFKSTKFKTFAVGKGTALVLKAHKLISGEIFYPESGAGSQALLSLPELQDIQGKNILIVTGSDGKPFLEEQLLSKGASVMRWECYERVKPQALSVQLKAVEDKNIKAVFLHSAHAAQHFMESASQNMLSSGLVAVVGAQAIADKLNSMAWQGAVHQAASPMPQDMLACFQTI